MTRVGPHAQIGLARVAHMAWPKIHTSVWHAHVGPHAQFGLARVAHTAILQPPHGRVLHTAKPSSTTRSCLTHGQQHG
ncbi:hypothetical protein J1N35_036369 [Gossypium stocksii]|uniref:Uncharacterized protein n=1 Tax=Gossypium stocksii TaxID=47602 RepID=A0A9D3UII2_9ROSI|nr:hypothetical protein J1N35_036369 [Gossypium stocksii]